MNFTTLEKMMIGLGVIIVAPVILAAVLLVNTINEYSDCKEQSVVHNTDSRYINGNCYLQGSDGQWQPVDKSG